MTSLKKSQHPYVQTAGLIVGGTTLLLAALAVKYPDRPPFTESRDDLPTTDSYPLVGITPTIIKHRQTIHEYLLNTTRLSTKTVGTSIGIGIPRNILTTHPQNVDYILRVNFENYIKGPIMNDVSGDLLGQGIFNADGDIWKYQRKAALHIFKVKNFRDNFSNVFLRNIGSMKSGALDTAAQTQMPIDLHDIMHRITLDSFLEISFGVSSQDLSTKDKATFVDSFDACQRNAIQRIVNPAHRITEGLEGWLMPWKTSMKQHLANVDKFAYDVISKRRQELDNGDEFGDLLSRFMTTKNDKDELLNDKELRDIILNFVIAGRDTTAQAISWTFYMLLTNPGVKYKLLAEINESITDDMENDPAAMYETVKGMKYANAVLCEVLRLYPPVPALQKMALSDDVWPDGTKVKKNDLIVLPTYSQGRSRMIWGDDAEKFKPERWFTEEGTIRQEPPSKWIVFNAGPRACIGQVLASTVALITIATLLRQYDFKLVRGQEITYQVAMTLPMKNGMKVNVNRRR